KFRAKLLRFDDESGVTITYAEYLRQTYHGTFVHPEFEEAYCLQGEISQYEEEVEGHVRFVPGSYVSRQPGGRHGDHVITKGCVILLRVHGREATRISPMQTHRP